MVSVDPMAATSDRSEPEETGEREGRRLYHTQYLRPQGFWSRCNEGEELGALTTGRDVALVRTCQVVGIEIGVPTVMK